MTIARIAMAALAWSGASMTATAQQADTPLTMFTVTTYGLEADNHCQVYDYMQRQTAEHIQKSMRGVLVGRAGEAAVADEEARLAGIARADWDGCPPRIEHAGGWKDIDISRLYIDALIGAPGAMDKDIKTCAIVSGGRPLERAEMDAAKALADARQRGGAFSADYDLVQDMFAGAIAGQCRGQGFSPEMVGPSAVRDRNLLKKEISEGVENSLSVFGEWTSYRYFSFTAFEEFGVSAYRASGEGVRPVASVRLTTEGALGANGYLYAMSDGTLR
ncbi:MAG: hypothetical protein RLN72_03075, partial [Henriciella sp.]